jgi:hypothetical protein
MKYFCLFFARGCCPYGWECEYLHLLPDASFVLPDNSKDCFARDKFADYRDDMGGVGSFQRINRTLYIGRIKELGSGPETEEMVRRHFKEWGDIEHSKFPFPCTVMASPATSSSCPVLLHCLSPHFPFTSNLSFIHPLDYESDMKLTLLYSSPCPPIPFRRLCYLHPRGLGPICKRGDGMPVPRL